MIEIELMKKTTIMGQSVCVQPVNVSMVQKIILQMLLHDLDVLVQY